MEELKIVSYEQAKSLRKLGFPKDGILQYHECPYCFYNGHRININSQDDFEKYYSKGSDNEILYAPTLKFVAKWLEKEKNIIVLPYLINFVGISNDSVPDCLRVNTFGCQVVYYDEHKKSNEFLTIEAAGFVSVEDALCAGIDKVIEILTSDTPCEEYIYMYCSAKRGERNWDGDYDYEPTPLDKFCCKSNLWEFKKEHNYSCHGYGCPGVGVKTTKETLILLGWEDLYEKYKTTKERYDNIKV